MWISYPNEIQLFLLPLQRPKQVFLKNNLSYIFFDQGSLQVSPGPELPNLTASRLDQAESVACTNTALGEEYPSRKS